MLVSVVGTETDTATSSAKDPDAVVAVIVAVPSPTALTRPEAFTVATPTSLEDQIILRLVALAGEIVGFICPVCPGSSARVAGDMLIPVTGTLALTE